jgi:hypothetical protein
MPAPRPRLAEDRPVRTCERWTTTAGLVAVSAASWVLWLNDPGDPLLFALLAIVTLASALLVALVSPRERGLAASLVVVVPVLGPVIAAWAVSARGRGGADLLADPGARRITIDAAELARRLTCALPPCDALVSRDVDVRRAAISRLAARATADDVNLLRWARSRREPDGAAEIAFALEDLEQRFVRQLRAARAAADDRPAAAFELIARAVLAGIVDARLVTRLAGEARDHYDAAIAREPDRARALLGTRARLELAVRRPELALALLERAYTDEPASELGKLYLEAAYAARAFDRIPRAG